jgi:hypothetical protein
MSWAVEYYYFDKWHDDESDHNVRFATKEEAVNYANKYEDDISRVVSVNGRVTHSYINGVIQEHTWGGLTRSECAMQDFGHTRLLLSLFLHMGLPYRFWQLAESVCGNVVDCGLGVPLIELVSEICTGR